MWRLGDRNKEDIWVGRIEEMDKKGRNTASTRNPK